MHTLFCECGNQVYPDNRSCLQCGRDLGFDCQSRRIISYTPLEDGNIHGSDGVAYRLCRNRAEFDACNGLAPVDSNDSLCFPCSLNRTIPNLGNPVNLGRWQRLEQAKRRLVCSLSALGLPEIGNIRFDFLEDKRSHPDAIESFITTGHSHGVITINTLEADEVQRTYQKQMSSERYRTLLGHFRHEAGHYYYNILVTDLPAFESLFGNPHQDYDTALQTHYRDGPIPGWEESYISAYASSHPLEDWAESFAHYLHIGDAMETAQYFGLWAKNPELIEEKLESWSQLSIALNETNQALGLRDAYPFVINQRVADKLAFIDRLIKTAANSISG